MDLKNFGRIPRKHSIFVIAVVGIFIYINRFEGVFSTQRPNEYESKNLNCKILVENVNVSIYVQHQLFQNKC